jgi:TetR/AcrR family transcriptional regulator, transcriptional repressor for nem operon
LFLQLSIQNEREAPQFEKVSSRSQNAQLSLIFTPITYILVGMLVARTSPQTRLSRLRDPERTRERLLQAASREIYRSGFQSARVTKGALYYHFDGKEALGLAVVDEVIAPDVRGKWVRPFQSVKDPIDALIGAVQRLPVQPADARGGCQLNNMAQEMSPHDEGFRKRLAIIFDAWRKAIASVLRGGQTHGSVRRDVEPADAGRLTGRDGRRLCVAGKECSGSEGDESGDQKHRGLDAFSARAGQPQARVIASLSKVAVWHRYIPTGSYARTVSIATGVKRFTLHHEKENKQ